MGQGLFLKKIQRPSPLCAGQLFARLESPHAPKQAVGCRLSGQKDAVGGYLRSPEICGKGSRRLSRGIFEPQIPERRSFSGEYDNRLLSKISPVVTGFRKLNGTSRLAGLAAVKDSVGSAFSQQRVSPAGSSSLPNAKTQGRQSEERGIG